ncbi:hypothetical protein HBI56_050470 [Parastagonospora nodorum]|nr:hypothetical protein HBH51_131410 [Parastagonospora nodorum]KAH4051127.1 hypothetical protein HBH49_113520 [Parastagonospora nodorum]KAH4090994.1 hypothetical protein HBH46_187340 [Parastagonospora nodorum]KAH4303447.1 hypothetical protein HBI01_087120 [Parastagonospora nodorum]KAH4318790.1 hypothetical protein HBI02_009820 [Parastagonospora nodorum]
MYNKPEAPKAPDHYSSLDLQSDATQLAIKKAFKKLELKHHPDKQAPGQTVDAVEFRKVREAYEILTDAEQREAYELEHPDIQGQWQRYRHALAEWEIRVAAEADAAALKARCEAKRKEQQRICKIREMGEREKVRRAAVEVEESNHDAYVPPSYRQRRCECYGCRRCRHREWVERESGLPYPSPEEYAEYLQMRADDAERRSQEAMRKRREEQEREAKERMRKEQEKLDRIKNAEDRKRRAKKNVKDERTRETARRAREQQEKDAQLRMAKAHIKAQQDKYMGDRAEDTVPVEEVSINIGWTKKKGVAKCLFCDEEIKYYSFRCPDGGAIACNPCKNNMCKFTPPKQEKEDSSDDSEWESEAGEDEGDQHRDG